MQVKDIRNAINALLDIILYQIYQNVKYAKQELIQIQVQLHVLYEKLAHIHIKMDLLHVILVEVILILMLVFLLALLVKEIVSLIRIILDAYHARKGKF
jgi:hypothetical protein